MSDSPQSAVIIGGYALPVVGTYEGDRQLFGSDVAGLMVLVTEKRTVSDPKERTVNAGMELMKVAPAGSTGDLEGPLSAELEALDEELRETLAASVAPSTTRAYDRAWRSFCIWCDGYGLVSLPASPQTVARYLKVLAGTHKPATLTQHCSAIAGAHKAAGYAEPPTRSLLVHKTLTGLRRQQGVAPDAKAPLTVADLRTLAINAGLNSERRSLPISPRPGDSKRRHDPLRQTGHDILHPQGCPRPRARRHRLLNVAAGPLDAT